MQNPIPKFRQSSIISEKPHYLSEKLKTLTTSNYQIFCRRFTHVSYLIILHIFVNKSISEQNKKNIL